MWFCVFCVCMIFLYVIKSLLFYLDQIISSDVTLCILRMHDFSVCFEAARIQQTVCLYGWFLSPKETPNGGVKYRRVCEIGD